MRDGKPCGLNTTSGIRPDSVNGKSSAGHFCEQIPFCPARDANLSPTEGFLWKHKTVKIKIYLSYSLKIYVLTGILYVIQAVLIALALKLPHNFTLSIIISSFPLYF